MRALSIVLLVAGIVLIIGGNFFFTKKDNPVDNRSLTVTTGGNKSFQWPVYTGIILIFVGGTFYLATRKSSKVDPNPPMK